MKITIIIAGLVLLISGVTNFSTQKRDIASPSAPLLDESLKLQRSTPLAPSENYCLGIRGNGENAPAHWSALARIVREVGMPTAISAGSSGSYSAFLLESVAINENANTKEKQGALFQTFPIYLDAFLSTTGIKEILDKENKFEDLKAGLKAIGHLRLLNPRLFSLGGLLGRDFKTSVTESVQFFGKFSPSTDHNLFVREGLVDFKYVALEIMGRMGDLYAGNSDERTKESLKEFMNSCSSDVSISKECQAQFQKIAHKYIISLDKKNRQNKRIHEKLGAHIKSYVSTGLIVGEGVKKMNKAKKAFKLQSKDHKKLLANLSFDFDKEIFFGYFGDQSGLDKINSNLDKRGDLKSKKFKAIGPASWFEALSVSPAEPGLANVQEIPYKTSKALVSAQNNLTTPSLKWKALKYRKDMISTGGWSDLHPMQVLKASGCETTLYLTRQNGDSNFAQQTFIKLAGEQDKVPFWKDIKKYNREGWNSDRKGWIAATEDSKWNQLYNLGNKNSSYSKAIRLADVVYCTDWDRHTPKKMQAMLYDAFTAPVFLKDGVSKNFQINPVSKDKHGQGFPGCVPKRL